VIRNWDAEIGDDRPDDADEMVQQYFAEVLEAYDIQESVKRINEQLQTG
jgi:hypothetical protein